MRSLRDGRGAVRWLLLGVALASSARAADETPSGGPAEGLARAETLARAGRCAEAEPLLQAALDASPRDARAALLLGQCEIRLGDYPRALAALERAQALDPALADLDLSLGMARYHTGDMDGALASLDRARERGTASAQLDFYQGLAYLERARAAEAAEALERASAADPAGVDPAATYYAAVAWDAAGEGDRSEAALERVIAGWPGTSWATAAQRLADELRRAKRPTWWTVASAGVETDSNPTLVGDDVVLFPDEISGRRDTRAVWSLELGSELWRADEWSAGARAFYYGNDYHDLSSFDTQYPSASLWLDRRFAETDTVRLQYDFGYAWVDGQPYLATQWLTPSWYHDWGNGRGTTRLFSELLWNNYFFDEDDVVSAEPDGDCPPGFAVCGPAGVDEASARNADGWGMTYGVEHVVPIAALRTDVAPGFRFAFYDSRGTEWSNASYDFRVTTHSKLPFEFLLDLVGGYTYQPYRHRSTFPSNAALEAEPPFEPYALTGPARRDHIGYVDVTLERKIVSFLSGSLRYAYQNHHSNTDVFDYDQHVFGAYLTVRIQE